MCTTCIAIWRILILKSGFQVFVVPWVYDKSSIFCQNLIKFDDFSKYYEHKGWNSRGCLKSCFLGHKFHKNSSKRIPSGKKWETLSGGTSPLYARSTHCGRRAFENSKIINFSKNLAKVLINLPGNSIVGTRFVTTTVYYLLTGWQPPRHVVTVASKTRKFDSGILKA